MAMFLLRLAATEFKGDYLHRSLLQPNDLDALDHGCLEGAALFTEEEVDAVMLHDAANVEALEPHPSHEPDSIERFFRRLACDREDFSDLSSLLKNGKFLSSLDFALRVKWFIDDDPSPPSAEDFQEALKRAQDGFN